MRAEAIWESHPLPAVPRRIRWNLTGFELGRHFPSLNKWREKWFEVYDASFYVLNVFRFARWRTGARARPVRPYRMSRRPRFAQLAKQTEPKNRAEPRGVILCVLVTTAKDGIGIRQLS